MLCPLDYSPLKTTVPLSQAVPVHQLPHLIFTAFLHTYIFFGILSLQLFLYLTPVNHKINKYGEVSMFVLHILGAIIAIGLLIYLIVALVKAEDF